MKTATRMTGIGSAFPPRRMTNSDIAKLVDTNDEWVKERTGISERRISDLKNPDEQNSALGKAAALKALEMAGKTVDDIDGILYATCTPDTLIPSTACWLQHRLGAKRAWAVDLNAACSGFVFGVNLGRAMIESGQAKTILVCGVDTVSAFVDWTDRGTCILFGDGAGACILEAVPESSESKILGSRLGSDGDLWEIFHMPAGGSNMEVTPEVHEQKLDKMKMKGKEIFKVAVKTLADYAQTTLANAGYTADDVAWLVPHQANLRIIEAVANRLDFPMEKVLINIDRYGNTSAATAPSAFDEAVRDGRVKKGDLILFDVFGAGLTYGSLLLRW
jgi:3-oxoacyl-[acyl-carrier-protein] synthase-3